MGILESLNPAAQSVSQTWQGVTAIMEMVKKWRAYRIGDITTLKMLYLELDRFLELAEILDSRGAAKKTIEPATIFRLLAGVDLTVTGLVLAREEKHSAFRKLMKRGILGGRSKIARRRDYENVLQALSFIYSKTAILKQIAETGDKVFFREIKFRERFGNITECVNLVLKVLVTFPEVNVIARRWHRQDEPAGSARGHGQ